MEGRTLDIALRELAALRGQYWLLSASGEKEDNLTKRLGVIDEVNTMLAMEFTYTKRERAFVKEGKPRP